MMESPSCTSVSSIGGVTGVPSSVEEMVSFPVVVRLISTVDPCIVTITLTTVRVTFGLQ